MCVCVFLNTLSYIYNTTITKYWHYNTYSLQASVSHFLFQHLHFSIVLCIYKYISQIIIYNQMGYSIWYHYMVITTANTLYTLWYTPSVLQCWWSKAFIFILYVVWGVFYITLCIHLDHPSFFGNRVSLCIQHTQTFQHTGWKVPKSKIPINRMHTMFKIERWILIVIWVKER